MLEPFNEALADAEIFSDEEFTALKRLVDSLAMRATELWGGLPQIYLPARTEFYRQIMRKVIERNMDVFSMYDHYRRPPLPPGERMTRGEALTDIHHRWKHRTGQ